MKHTILYLSALLFATCFLFAQKPVVVHLTEKDGLPDVEFYGILEDHEGFVWLAANKGLYRYDGKEFKNYSHPKKRGLSVFGLKRDPFGRLWCNNISGQYFYVEKDTLRLFTDLKAQAKGQLSKFLVFDNKLEVYNNLYGYEIDLSTRDVKNIFTNTSGMVSAFTSKDSLFYFNNEQIKYKTKTKHQFQTAELSNLTKVDHVEKTVYPLGTTYLMHALDRTTRDQKFYLWKGQQFQRLSPQELEIPGQLISLYYENDCIWFCTKKGLYKYRYVNGKFEQIEVMFQNYFVTGVLKDQRKNYWISTLRNGIFIMPNIEVKQFPLDQQDTHISALVQLDASNFMYGTVRGNVGLISKDPLRSKTVYSYPDKVNKLAFNGVDNVFVSYGEHEVVLNKKNFQPLKTNELLRFNNAKGFTFIGNNKVLLGGYASADLIDISNGNSLRLRDRRSYATHYNAHTKRMYVGYVDGLKYYNERLESNSITFNALPIFAIDIDHTRDNTVWVSTFSDGLIGIKNGKVEYNYTTKNGLLSNQTGVIKADGNCLWIATDKGLQRLNVLTKEFKNLTRKDGITSFNISDILIFKDEVVFGTNKGVFQIDKKRVFKEKTLPRIYFTKVLIEDEKMVLSDGYTLAPDQKKIEIQFHANGFLTNDDVVYKYRLLGAHNDWSEISNGVHEVVFNSLAPGTYTFELKGTVERDTVATKIHAIAIEVKRPFYKEGWFLVLMGLVWAVVIWRYIAWRFRALELKQQEHLEKERINKRLIASQLESLRSQMNPHFIFNALNSIQEYIVLNEKHLASAFLVKFSRLIRLYLEHSQKHYINLSEEIHALELYLELEKDRFEDSLEYTIDVSEALHNNSMKVPSIFIQPYVENAITHGLLHKMTQRILKVHFDLKQDHLRCTIEDNGIGRVASKALKKQSALYHKSYATKANQRRIDLINSGRETKIEVVITDLYSKHKAPKGTKVVIKIPINKHESTTH